jgi:tRNA (guanine-N7-)-methyltransferase
MGRRALRKIRPDLDLSHHFLALDELAIPLDPAQLFGRAAPLELEVGSGKGLFLAQAARTTRQRDFLGSEIALRYARFAAARLAHGKIPNAKIVHGDAQRLLRDYVSDESIVAVHVYFPDPWWKKRHHKRRVMNKAFLMDVHRVLVRGGVLHFWTDVEEYFRLACELIATHIPRVSHQPVAETPASHDLDYRTHFERRTRLADKPVFRAQFVKD